MYPSLLHPCPLIPKVPLPPTPPQIIPPCEHGIDAISCKHTSLLCMLQVSFDVDLKVNVFEANIRLLGGLISAHLLASDPELGLMQKPYQDQLLTQAADLGNRLLAAFDASPTGASRMHACMFAFLCFVNSCTMTGRSLLTAYITHIHTSPNSTVHGDLTSWGGRCVYDCYVCCHECSVGDVCW